VQGNIEDCMVMMAGTEEDEEEKKKEEEEEERKEIQRSDKYRDFCTVVFSLLYPVTELRMLTSVVLTVFH
jgi:hypothetical protein